MGVKKDSVYLERQVQIEEDKIRILDQRRTDPNRQTPYQQRETTMVAVRSTSKPAQLWYRVPVTTESLTKLVGGVTSQQLAGLGLVLPEAVPEADALRTNKYATFDYPKILVIHGTGSPQRVITEWGTKWTRKYAPDGSQSHRLIPFGPSTTVATPTWEDVETWFATQFALVAGETPTVGPLRAGVGANGSVSLILGKNSVVSTIKM